jgi:APA family basic amino acid/polyamine antiporter
VSLSVGALLVFAIASFGSVRSAHLRPFTPYGWQAVLQASALMFFAYTGYARIATLAEEVVEPRRTIPRAIHMTLGVAVLLYIAVAFTAVGSVGSTALSATSAPLLVAAAGTGYSWLPAVVAAGGVAAMLGVILSQVLGLSRMVLAMSRRDDLPQALAVVHPRYGTPVRAILVVGAAAATIAATGALDAIAAVASFAILVYYGIANVAALRMPSNAKLYTDAVPVAGLIACTVLALSLPAATIGVGTLVLAGGLGGRAILRGARPAG